MAVTAGFNTDDVPGKLANHIATGHPVGQGKADGLAAAVAETQADAEEMLFRQGSNGVVEHLLVSLELNGIQLFQETCFVKNENLLYILFKLHAIPVLKESTAIFQYRE